MRVYLVSQPIQFLLYVVLGEDKRIMVVPVGHSSEVGKYDSLMYSAQKYSDHAVV